MKLAMLLLIFPASFCILAEPCPPQAKLLEMRMQSNRMQLNHAILKHPEDYSAACIKKAAGGSCRTGAGLADGKGLEQSYAGIHPSSFVVGTGNRRQS